MFIGLFRFSLAILVVLEHLNPSTFKFAGPPAVFGFYVVSGYLITRVAAERYSNGIDGLRRFWINRILRLYPSYLTVAAFSALTLLLFSATAEELNQAMRLPGSAYGVAVQFTIFGLLLPWGTPYWARLVPPAWSLNMELVFYLVISVLFARSKKATICWFAVSLLAWIPLIHSDAFKWAYFSPLGASLCFAAGALLFHLKPRTPDIGPAFILVSIGLFCTLAALLHTIPFDRTVLLAISAVAAVLILYCIMYAPQPRAFSDRWTRTDSLLADLAYPVFILHWPLSVWLAEAFSLRLGSSLVLVTLPVLVIGSYLLVAAIERPIQAVRVRFRG